jgi:hypothetical protein
VSPMHLVGKVSVDFAVLESEAGVGDMLTLLSSASGKCSSAQALHWLGCVTSGGKKCRSNSNRIKRLQDLTNVAELPLGSMPGEQEELQALGKMCIDKIPTLPHLPFASEPDVSQQDLFHSEDDVGLVGVPPITIHAGGNPNITDAELTRRRSCVNFITNLI